MSVAVLTASASVIVAVLAFVLNQWGQARVERRAARLERVNAQIRDLYGPLNALADANETVWEALRDARLPDTATRRSGTSPAVEDEEWWSAWMTHALMPTNRRMRELILNNAHLIVEPELPEPLRVFCAHVAALEVAAALREARGGSAETLVHHPGRSLNEYLDSAYTGLKREQARLASGT
jgi:hypothetical protein